MKVKLGDLIEEYSERNIDNKYKPVAVGKYGIRARESIYSKELAKDYSKNKLIYKGTLTIGMGSNQIDIGILRDDEIYSVSPAYHTYNIKISNYDYLDYLLTANNNRMFSIYANRGSRQGKTLDLKRWLTDELRLHDEKDQKIIVQTLNAVKQLISQKEAELVKLDNLIKARFVEMFGVPGANSKGWNEIKLGEVCSLQNGYAFKSSDYINKSGVLNCRMSNIRPDGGFDAEYHPKYLPEEYWDKRSGYRLFDGDVIIAMTDMASDPKILGVPTIVSTNGKKFLLNQRVGKLSFLHDDRMNRIYLMHSLGQKYIRKELAKSAAGSTQINVGKPAILNINIYDPPRSLQDQFATFVAQVDKSKFVLSNELAMCDFYIRLIHDRVMHSRINLRVAQ